MVTQPLTLLELLALLVLGLSFIWILASIGNKRLAAQEQLDDERLLRPLSYYAYFCPNHHYLGQQEPPKGQFCQQCVAEGLIKATCHLGGEPHPARPLTVDQMMCPVHGLQEVTQRSIITKKLKGDAQEEPVSRAESLTHNQAKPLPVPLPCDYPLPRELVEQATGSTSGSFPSFTGLVSEIGGRGTSGIAGIASDVGPDGIPEQIRLANLFQLEHEVLERLERLEQELLARQDDLDAEIPSRRRQVWFWHFVVALVLVALIGFSPVLLALFIDPGDTLQSAVEGLVRAINSFFSLALFMFAIWLIVFLTILLFARFRREKWGIKWLYARATFVLTELLALVILPYLFKQPVSLPGVLIGLGFDIVAEVIAFALRWTWTLRRMVGQTRVVTAKLNEVREALEDWGQTLRFLSVP